jgi:hypothetical protein
LTQTLKAANDWFQALGSGREYQRYTAIHPIISFKQWSQTISSLPNYCELLRRNKTIARLYVLVMPLAAMLPLLRGILGTTAAESSQKAVRRTGVYNGTS